MPEQAQSENKVEIVPIIRPEGLNDSERYLAKLCDKSFLSLWSYSSLTRDQGRTTNKDGVKVGDGKELCDLLVVFGNDIIIFQDKDCKFTQSGDLQLKWERWYKEAVLAGAKQIWGAERWIKEYPELIFIDRLCTQSFPLAFPDASQARYHRVIVAHGASESCKKEYGGSGSLMIRGSRLSSGIFSEPGKTLFTVGQADPAKGFVHIFDDTTLDIVLQTLDTTSDFVDYLTKKEAFVSSEQFLNAAGEEELLAYYLTHMNTADEHDFVFSENTFISLAEGEWDDFCKNPQRKAQLKANEVSYAWDDLIETFNKHNLAGTHYYVSHSLREIEQAVRFLASENRLGRRILSEALSEIIKKTPTSKRAVRVSKSPFQLGVYYLFMLFPGLKQKSEEDNRIFRRQHLIDYCKVVKLRCTDAEHIVGIATESGLDKSRSGDLIYINVVDWSKEQQEEAEQIQEEKNILNNVHIRTESFKEYPDTDFSRLTMPDEKSEVNTPYQNFTKIGRNALCPCGSGNKFKRCHGK